MESERTSKIVKDIIVSLGQINLKKLLSKNEYNILINGNNKDTISELKNQHSGYYNILSKKLQYSLKEYVGLGHQNINDIMKNETRFQIEHDLEDIDEANKNIGNILNIIKYAPPVISPLIVYRGLFLEFLAWEKYQKLSPGDIIDLFTYGFTSTTLTKSITEQFANDDGSSIYKILIPKGTKGLYIGIPDLQNKGEDEFLLSPGYYAEIISAINRRGDGISEYVVRLISCDEKIDIFFD